MTRAGHGVRWPTPLAATARTIDTWWMAPAPAERLAALRILVGLFAVVYLAARTGHILAYAHYDRALFEPVGVVALVLDRPLLPVVVQILTLATAVMSVPFLLGWRHRITGPVFAALLLWTLTYRNSWGMVFHTENLLVLDVLVLGLTRSADAWSLDARRRGGSSPEPASRYGWPIRLLCAIFVCAYVLAGVAKLRLAGVDWLWGDELRNHIATDNARKLLLGDWYSPLAGPLLEYALLFKSLALVTVLVELGAPLALLGGRVTAVWVALAYGFHVGVLALMFILFPFQLTGIAFACFFRVERPVERWITAAGRRGRRRGARRACRGSSPR